MKKTLITAGLILFAASAAAQGLSVDDMKVFNPATIKWGEDPALPKGAKVAVLVGDPSKAETFVALIKFPPHYKVQPHTHPFPELITIVSGSLGNGMGDKFDAKKGEVLKAGTSFALPAKHAHYVWTADQPTVLQLVASGPWGLEYINPADDPRKKK
ncbi:cupin domain-containing protein [Dechloromonas sp. XY25]|uniref:Cupin domain-containing protein n=1 Tax=Dechloromonas hankyongensis TaxID=2908002 RepID=A0ABS9JYA4_9RHOO|nr:cupin domain-containing protein [Dechloromonas hankyongensis]MCG2575894.1 cupin domain-containing protein [Dechloromonas hankyongensis]